MDWHAHLSSETKVCGGVLCASGTRVPVTVILDSLADDSSREGAIRRASQEAAANSGGSTIRAVTRLTQAPQVGRALTTSVGEGAEALGNLAGRSLQQVSLPNLYHFWGMPDWAERSITTMGTSVATEIKFLPAASGFFVRFFH